MSRVQLSEWNRTEAEYPRNSSIAQLFRQQAALTPDRIAVIFTTRQLSYREVDERSEFVACRLRSLGVKPEMLVGIFVERSEALLIGLLAILKAGGAYVPLDPSHPKERLALIIQDAQMPIVLASRETRESLPKNINALTLVEIEDCGHGATNHLESTPVVAGYNLAYVMYTSGSTGTPKGVMIEHRNVINFFTGMDRAIGCEPGVWLAVTSVTFDISVLEFLWTLTRGFTIVIHGDKGSGKIGDEIIRHSVTHLQMTPSLARMLTLDQVAFSALASLKQLLLGGEVVSASLIRTLRQIFNGEIYNMYGPTETTIWSTTYKVREPGDRIPIGRPIANMQVFVLGADFEPIPPGETGELFLGGDGVARGYWKRPELTAERFLTLPSLSEAPLYRTGDVARFLPDGNLEFLGRTDHQIKLRGHRIEPGEIETLIERCAGVRQAVVVAREEREGDRRLIAYLVAEAAGQETVGMLKSALGEKLPHSMIPSAFVFLPALPLTANGKIDRNALLEWPPPPGFAETRGAGRMLSEPENEFDRIVAEAWQEALGLSSIGLNDNFFDLGAHSLTVAEVQATLQNALKREIPLVDLFQFSTVTSLSRHLSGTRTSAAPSTGSGRALRRRLARQE